MRTTFTRRDLVALTAALMAAAPAHAMATPTDRRAAPDDSAAGLTQVSQLIGKQLRVIRPNQAVTMDYSEDRVNIEVDDSGKILRVFTG